MDPEKNESKKHFLIRSYAVWALGKFTAKDYKDDISRLAAEELAEDNKSEFYTHAKWALLRMGEEISSGSLHVLLQDTIYHTQQAYVLAVARIGMLTHGYINDIAQLLDHKDPAIKGYAAWGVANMYKLKTIEDSDTTLIDGYIKKISKLLDDETKIHICNEDGKRNSEHIVKEIAKKAIEELEKIKN
jgi:hypothetical protein